MCQACGEGTIAHDQIKRVVWVGLRPPTAVEDRATAECFGKAAGTVITVSEAGGLEREIVRHQDENTTVFISADVEPSSITRLRDAGLRFNVISVEETRGIVIWIQPAITHYQGSLIKRCRTKPSFRFRWPWNRS